MLDFNHRPTFQEQVGTLLDDALARERDAQTPRDYLGASRLGVNCERALQFEYTQTPVDPGRAFSGRLLRVFEVGHQLEELVIRWLRLMGFDLYTRNARGGQFGFSVAQGRIKGHVDGILNSGPASLGMSYPALWECKTMNDKSWRDTVKNGVAKSKPVYAAQMAVYQAYMEVRTSGSSWCPSMAAWHSACPIGRCGSSRPPTREKCCPDSRPPPLTRSAASVHGRNAAGVRLDAGPQLLRLQ